MSKFGITSKYDDRLKSCSFCGGDAWLVEAFFDDDDTWYRPECRKCMCGWQRNYETEQEAIDAWNDRRMYDERDSVL